MNYWASKDHADRRLIFAADSYLQEVNANTAVTINTFGNDGRVDLREGLGRDPKTIRNIQSGTPGRVFENLIILGSAPGEGYGSEPGDIRSILLKARNEGLFTPPATRDTIDMPGELGGNNWGGSAADPTTGTLFVRSTNAPTLHKLSLRPPRRRFTGATPEQQGHAIFSERCEGCHGANRNGVVFPMDLGLEKFKAIVGGGQGEMPAVPDLTPRDLNEPATYIDNPAAGDRRKTVPRRRQLSFGQSGSRGLQNLRSCQSPD